MRSESDTHIFSFVLQKEMRALSLVCCATRMRVCSTLRFEANMFRPARNLNRTFAGLRQFGTPIKKEVVSRVNVLVLNAGVNSVKYGLFSIASRPAGHDWLQKDSFLLSSGRHRFFTAQFKYGLSFVVLDVLPGDTATLYPPYSVCRFDRPRRGGCAEHRHCSRPRTLHYLGTLRPLPRCPPS